MANVRNGFHTEPQKLMGEPRHAVVKEEIEGCTNCGAPVPSIDPGVLGAESRYCNSCLYSTMSPSKQGCVGKVKSKAKVARRAANASKRPLPFDWGTYFDMLQSDTAAAPVNCFKHCCMSDCWDNIVVGMKVEVPNRRCNVMPSAGAAYWIASVIKLAGYRARLRYEGYGTDSIHDFWASLCSSDLHPVGWCATSGRPLVPPSPIEGRHADWKEFLVHRLTGARTLPCSFYDLMVKKVGNHSFRKGMLLEVVDKACISSMRVARVAEIVDGRLHLQYEPDVPAATENCIDARNGTVEQKPAASVVTGGMDDFWCHHRSPVVHYVGWAAEVGHVVQGSAALPSYADSSLAKLHGVRPYEADECTRDFFCKVEPHCMKEGLFTEGMKLEAVDPLNLSTICVATVMRVLHKGYLMIGIDGCMDAQGTDWFCYHATSPSIFPVGFCELNDIELTPPRGYKAIFRWIDYLKHENAKAAPVSLFEKNVPRHSFKVGMKLEAVDLMDPRLICVATITRIVGRLLRLNFDGWDSTYDQWIDCESADIYPVGWCEIVNYHVEGPRQLLLSSEGGISIKKNNWTKRSA